jgi:hypothetical protein
VIATDIGKTMVAIETAEGDARPVVLSRPRPVVLSRLRPAVLIFTTTCGFRSAEQVLLKSLSFMPTALAGQ